MKENLVLTEATYYILLALLKPNHGYGIMQTINALSQKRLTMAAGTLYGALQKLVDKQWIIAMKTEENSRKKEYVITQLGEQVLRQELARLKELVQNGEELLS